MIGIELTCCFVIGVCLVMIVNCWYRRVRSLVVIPGGNRILKGRHLFSLCYLAPLLLPNGHMGST